MAPFGSLRVPVQPSLSILLVFVSLLPCFRPALGHAVLTVPVPRGGAIQGNGPKITPFGGARTVANGLDGGDGCGGQPNGDAGQGDAPTVVFRPGEQISVQWSVRIPHDPDREESGVRIAIHYGDGDSYAENILAGGVEGDPSYEPLSAGSDDAVDARVTLPAGKTCACCTLQWVWAARRDGGFYVGCADVAISEDGQLPTSCATGDGAPNGASVSEASPATGENSTSPAPRDSVLISLCASRQCVGTVVMAVLAALHFPIWAHSEW